MSGNYCTCGRSFRDAEDHRDHLPCEGTREEQLERAIRRALITLRELTKEENRLYELQDQLGLPVNILEKAMGYDSDEEVKSTTVDEQDDELFDLDRELVKVDTVSVGVGDLVTLRSGGPLMTVQKLQTVDKEGDYAVCTWFSQDTETYTYPDPPHAFAFPVNCLIRNTVLS